MSVRKLTPKEFTDQLDLLLSMTEMKLQGDMTTGYSYGPAKKLEIKKVVFNNPATIILWSDGTKTVVKCGEHEIFDPEKGLAMAIAKRAFSNTGAYYNIFKKWLPENSDYKIIGIDISKEAFEDIVQNLTEEKDEH